MGGGGAEPPQWMGGLLALKNLKATSDRLLEILFTQYLKIKGNIKKLPIAARLYPSWGLSNHPHFSPFIKLCPQTLKSKSLFFIKLRKHLSGIVFLEYNLSN